MAAPRLFLEFDSRLQSEIINQTNTRFLFEPRKVVKDVASLASLIANEFGIPASTKLRLCVNGYAAPPQGPGSLLRDNDTVNVAPVPTLLTELGSDLEAAVRSAVASGPVKEALSQLLAAAQTLGGDSRQHASAGAMVVSAGKKAAKAEKEPQAAEQPSKPKKKRERAEAAEDAAALNSPAAPAKKKKKRPAGTKGDTQPAAADKEPPAKPILPAADTSSGDDDSADVSDSEEEAGTAGKGPSRSARRKKLKRQLRRQGVLDASLKQPSAEDRGAAAAAVREWREEEAPPAPQALPKRGDTWAKSRTDVQFMQEGHVYFPDSDDEEGIGGGNRRMDRAQNGQPERPIPRKLPGPPPRLYPSAAPEVTVLANGHVPNGNYQQQHLANGHQEPKPVRTQKQAPSKPVDAGPKTDAEFEALQRVELYPIEGDIIAYRLLHISADWTPQVSEWRKGRVIDLDEQNKVLTVEPWPDSSVHPLTGPRQPSPTGHETWSELDALQPHESGGEAEEEEEEGEQPPSDYNEDGVLVTALTSFCDMRLIRGYSPAKEQGAQPNDPEQAQPANGEKSGGADGMVISKGPSADGPSHQGTQHPHSTPLTANEHPSGLANGGPNLGPPKPGGTVVQSVGDWAAIAAQLKRRREELAAQKSSSAQAASPSVSKILTPGVSSASRDPAPEATQQPSAEGNGTTALQSASQGREPGFAVASEEQTESGRAVDAAAQTPKSQVIGSGIGTPGAAKPRPGVRSSAIGPLLARLRREATSGKG